MLTDNQLFINVEPEHQFRVKVFVPWQRKDWIQKIKSLSNRAWNKEKQYWSVPKSKATFEKLKILFGPKLRISKVLQLSMEDEKIEPPKKFISSISPTNLKLPIDLTFQEIRQGDRIFKVFVGEKIVIRKLNKKWLQILVPFDKKGWIAIIRDINGRKWDKMNCSWAVPYVKDTLDRLNQIDSTFLRFTFIPSKNIPSKFSTPSDRTKVTPAFQLNREQNLALIALEDKLLQERCSWRTVKSYKSHLKGLLLQYPKERPSKITSIQITKYLLKQIKTKKIAESTQNQLVNALKTFYKRVCNQPNKVNNLRPKRKPKQLPNVLSKKEVETFLNCIQNLKHKTILSLIYAAGLRKGEVIKLRKKDILFSRKCIFVNNAKGKKDRYIMLSPKIESMLRQYIKIHQPKYWLFEGATKGPYSETSLQNIFTKAKKKSGVNPYITIHGLRHSFATHLHEAGVPLYAIKDLLGHESIKTTEIYMHLSNKFMQQIQSPLDSLSIE